LSSPKVATCISDSPSRGYGLFLKALSLAA
jgi:hypothetical protein